MRRKMSNEEKRNKIIGIKVKTETRQKLDFIAKRERTSLSTYIDELLVKHIADYFSHAHIKWEDLTPEEIEGRELTSD